MSAQETAVAPAAEADAVELTEIVITGSFIPAAEGAIAVPTTVFDTGSLSRIGVTTNVLDILRKGMPAFAGNGNLGSTNANVGGNSTLGGSQLSLRNLATLVLVNGRRVATSGANGRGGFDFVDVNLIPPAAIERIEVLADGASALYGSDAIGGVVNIILKKDFQGVEFGGRYGVADGNGSYNEASGYVVAGLGNRHFNATIAASSSYSDPLFQADRPFSATITGRTATISTAIGQGTSFPTHQLAPGINSPSQTNPVGTAATATSLNDLVANGTYVPATFASIANGFDLAPFVTLLLEQERNAVFASANGYLLNHAVEVYADFLYSKNTAVSQLAAQPSTPNITVPAGAPYNPLTVAFPQVAFRYTPAPRIYTNEGELIRGILGAKGKIGEDYSWDVGYNYNESNVTVFTKNVLYAPNVNRAVAGGYNAQGVATPGGAYSRVITGFTESSTDFAIQPALDPFARSAAVDPASMNHVLGTSRADFASELEQLDARISAFPLKLPAGKLGVAVGLDYREESLSGTPDDNSRNTGPTARRWLGATFFDPFSRTREIEAGFVELFVPLTSAEWNFPGAHALELTAAYRYEEYSDVGDSSVPKVGLRYQPINEELTIRGTYSEAFAAPTLYSLYGPQTQGFTAAAVIPNVFNGIQGQAQSRTGSNPNLRPTTSTNYSFGFVYSPKFIKGLDLTVDYVQVDQKDVVGVVGTTAILSSVNAVGTASPYVSQVAIGAFPGEAGAQAITTAGQLLSWLQAGNSANTIFVSDQNVNIAGQKVEALDLGVNYRFDIGSLGQIEFGTKGTFFLTYEFQALPTQRYYNYAGYTSNGGTGAQGTIPDYRFFTSVTWQKDSFSATVGQTHISAVTDIGPGGTTFWDRAPTSTLAEIPVEAYNAWDLALSYTVSEEQAKGLLKLWKGAQFTIGVNNLTNELPPRANQSWNESNVDIATYGVLGRFFYADVKFKF